MSIPQKHRALDTQCEFAWEHSGSAIDEHQDCWELTVGAMGVFRVTLPWHGQKWSVAFLVGDTEVWGSPDFLTAVDAMLAAEEWYRRQRPTWRGI